MHIQFVADVHLGKLAKALRMLGFDTVYHNGFTKAGLIKIAVAENRVLLSRNASLEANPFIRVFIIQDEDPDAQLRQVITHFQLGAYITPFTRCLICNDLLQPVAKPEVVHRLPENTRLHFNEFWQCASCRRVYWKGSHYDRMQQIVQQIKQ